MVPSGMNPKRKIALCSGGLASIWETKQKHNSNRGREKKQSVWDGTREAMSQEWMADSPQWRDHMRLYLKRKN